MNIYDYPCPKAFQRKCFVANPDEWRKENALQFVYEMGQYENNNNRYDTYVNRSQNTDLNFRLRNDPPEIYGEKKQNARPLT